MPFNLLSEILCIDGEKMVRIHLPKFMAVKYICIYRCVYVHTCMYMYICVSLCIWMYVCECVFIHVYYNILYLLIVSVLWILTFEQRMVI